VCTICLSFEEYVTIPSIKEDQGSLMNSGLNRYFPKHHLEAQQHLLYYPASAGFSGMYISSYSLHLNIYVYTLSWDAAVT
jgi:hypothetical protein